MSEVGISAISTFSSTFVSGVGFSKGCVELALNQPPPLVPRCLMLASAATGPRVMVCIPWKVLDGVGTGVGVPAGAGVALAAGDGTGVAAGGGGGPLSGVAGAAPGQGAGVPRPPHPDAAARAIRQRVQSRPRGQAI